MKQKPPASAGITLTDCKNPELQENYIAGFDTGVSATRTDGLVATRNIILSKDVVATFQRAEKAITESSAEDRVKDALLKQMTFMYTNFGTPHYANYYAAFMAIAADHLQVLGPAFQAVASAFGAYVS